MDILERVLTVGGPLAFLAYVVIKWKRDDDKSHEVEWKQRADEREEELKARVEYEKSEKERAYAIIKDNTEVQSAIANQLRAFTDALAISSKLDETIRKIESAKRKK